MLFSPVGHKKYCILKTHKISKTFCSLYTVLQSVIMDFQTSEDDNLLDGDTVVGKFGNASLSICSHAYLLISIYIVFLRLRFGAIFFLIEVIHVI